MDSLEECMTKQVTFTREQLDFLKSAFGDSEDVLANIAPTDDPDDTVPYGTIMFWTGQQSVIALVESRIASEINLVQIGK